MRPRVLRRHPSPAEWVTLDELTAVRERPELSLWLVFRRGVLLGLFVFLLVYFLGSTFVGS